MPVVAEGSAAGRSPPGDQGCLARGERQQSWVWRAACGLRSAVPAAGLGAGGSAGRREGRSRRGAARLRLRLSGGSRGGQRPAGLEPPAALPPRHRSAPPGAGRAPRSAAFGGGRGEAEGARK